MNIFQFNYYREAIRSILLDKKEKSGSSFTFAKLAKACKLQSTYLSTVLKGEHHLNSDQIFSASEFLELSDDEYSFLCLLHEHERSIHPQRRIYLAQKIETERKNGLKTEKFLGGMENVLTTTMAKYEFYLNPNAPIVHMFLTIKKFRSNPESVRKILGLDSHTFDEALKCCEKSGFLSLNKGQVCAVVDSLHLPASSPLFPIYMSNLRQKANDFINTRSNSKHYTFVALYSASEETRSQIQNRFLEFLSWAQSMTQKTEPTHVYQMAFDLLCWSEG